MLRLVIMIFGCTVLAYLSERNNQKIAGTDNVRKERIFSFILICWMILFSGLRTFYNDTHTYLKSFRESAFFPDILKNFNWDLGNNPGFKILTAIFRTYTDNGNTYLLFASVVSLGISMGFVHKYTTNYPVSVFLFFTLGYFLFTMAAVKQTIAISIGLLAILAFFRGKKILYVVLILFASLFHTYILMYFIVPILFKMVPWKKGTYILIACTIVAAFAFNFLLGTIMNVTDFFGEGYSADAFVGEGINIFRVLVYFVPVVLSFIVRDDIQKKNSKEFNLFINFAIVCAMIMFVGLFGNANMFARLAMYFEVPIYVVLPWLIYKVGERIRFTFFTFFAGVFYSMYFYYMTVLSKPFDEIFKYLTIGEYLRTIFG